ncbi:hypothetical protein ABFS82_08G152500 [Erythranthe guttata]|uniref:Uncharacterized protein n=1 Tax=Erythranthe guttata TaxID=4155 RepID=A0A022QZ49_ERYGU|nr:PREDICTED: uncharacterized protein LOC105961904 [Erythranthe guttata]EYU33872.1 hypothetical protein MIMGU_mgv1a027009mg [Erythranthe guttata]|eukprot:XP_012841620.1 PREDICTED: uncharacterized protein LOC105961904 [Erythranthe guttata]
MEEAEVLPRILSPCTSGRRVSVDANSPEFEFWMVGNPSFPQPNLLSADVLFSGGFLLPLHLLQLQQPSSIHDPPPPAPEMGPSSTVDCTLTPSKRWRYIFKKSDKLKGLEYSDDHPITKEKKRDHQKKNGGGSGGGGASNLVSAAAELNINIWPFSRSRSAGNGGTRPRPAAAVAAARKVCSAPCSRSNSTGESKFRKWPPNSPSRAGVHLGRSSPVWKVRRGSGGAAGGGNEGRRKPPAPKARVLSLNVPMCIGYRHHLSCTSDENSAVSVAAAGGGGESEIGGIVSGEGVRRSNLFNIKSLFTKKVY